MLSQHNITDLCHYSEMELSASFVFILGCCVSMIQNVLVYLNSSQTHTNSMEVRREDGKIFLALCVQHIQSIKQNWRNKK